MFTLPMLEADATDCCETPQDALPTTPMPSLRMTAPPLMSVSFLARQNGFLDFFPGEPIGGVPETRLVRVSCAN